MSRNVGIHGEAMYTRAYIAQRVQLFKPQTGNVGGEGALAFS